VVARHSTVPFAMLIAAALTGCAVGPDFVRPAAPKTDSYLPDALPTQTAGNEGIAGAVQHYQPGADLPAQWWGAFHSEPLDGLIREALKNSPSVAAAQAALHQARDTATATRDSLFLPAATLNLGATRERLSSAALGIPASVAGSATTTMSIFSAAINATYTPDFFGGARRQLEGANAQVDYQRQELEATYLSLSSSLVTTAVMEASLRGQLKATHEIIAAEEDELRISKAQFQAGAIARNAVLTSQTQLSQTRAGLAPLEKALGQTRHELAILSGRPPSATDLPQFTLESFTLPEDLPVSLPSALVHQRPDILAAEAQLHAACAAVGVATANLYPQIPLTASGGYEALTLGQLFNASSLVWSAGASLVQPLFEGGALIARRRAAADAFDQAAAQYRETVLVAFQNVADALQALQSDADALASQAQADASAQASLNLTNEQFRLGAASHLELFIAQSQYNQTHLALISAQAARFADTAALLQAMGGGWWNRKSETYP
jgi:NodT family efflux transporter outer membrane factor (OMF) lipoprotein